MEAFVAIIAVWGGLASIGWIAVQVAGVHALSRLRRLGRPPCPDPPRWPKLSVVLSARDEAETIGPALETLLAQDYPDLEVVAVDDRSTDGTGEVIRRLAARDPRLVLRRVDRLPDGWLGKVHGLDTGVRAATGELVLFTDADVHFKPGALREAVALCEAERLDHLAAGPRVLAPNLATQIAVGAFSAMFAVVTKAHRVGAPGSDAFVGVGSFNLVRREAYDRSPGFAWLRLEVLDDVGLAYMLVRNGARSRFVLALDRVEVEWYPTASAMARGLEKNLFSAVARYRADRALGVLAVQLTGVLGPWLAIAQGTWPLARGLGIAAVGVGLCTAWIVARRTGQRFLPLALLPVGALMLAAFAARSAIVCLMRGGVAWRDTFYPLDRLRAGRRVPF